MESVTVQGRVDTIICNISTPNEIEDHCIGTTYPHVTVPRICHTIHFAREIYIPLHACDPATCVTAMPRRPCAVSVFARDVEC